MSVDVTTERAITDGVGAYLRASGVALPDDELQYQRLSGGRSHVTLRVHVRSPPSREVKRDLVVKHAGPEGPLAPYDVAHEARALAFAGSIGVPVPTLVGCSPAPDGNGGLVVMEHSPGEAPGLGDIAGWLRQRGDGARLHLGRQLLASLQAAQAVAPPWGDAGSLSEHYETFVDGYAGRLSEAARGVLVMPESATLAAKWLVRRCGDAVDEAPRSLTHGDFRIGNVLLTDAGDVVAIVDWERAMPGHPYHDVGYLCLPGMRIGGLISGVYTERELAEAWRDVHGTEFDRATCAYFRIVSMFTEFCTMLRALLRSSSESALRQSRSLPLIVTIQRDMLEAIESWERREPAL